ncbi:diguanylate cyclase domain-containing protein [Gaiella sp.]|uniref:GGDEF domain-containing protein n=1 Tax=Gaiella sp. TaxID=2663207 RepID=UPI003983364E
MMSTAALALLAAAVLAALIAGGIRVRRANRERHAALTRGLREMSDRLDSLARELAEALERVRVEGLRARILESLGGTLDLDEVLVRCAEAAGSLSGVAASAITVEIDGSPHVAAVGVDPSAVGPIVGPPGKEAARAVGLSYHYREGSSAAEQMLSAVAVPVESQHGRLGFLTVFGRDEAPPVAGTDFLTLEAIAGHAGPAIDRAWRTSTSPAPATDILTGLANRQVLHETLALEVARAHRAGESLAVCVLDVDNLSEANAHLGQPGADRLLGQIAALLCEPRLPRERVFRCGGDEFAVVLPSAGRIDAEATFARVQASLGRLPRALGFTPSLSAGIAELKPDDDGVSLFERAERALRHAKATRKGKGTAA